MRRILAALMGLVMLFLGMPMPAYASPLSVSIDVSATSPCVVELSGTSENTGGFRQSYPIENGKTTISLSLIEPDEYRYELRQIAEEGHEVYDTTVYDVYVMLYYEQDEMLSVVTGGIAGTDDKPEAFKFSNQSDEIINPYGQTDEKADENVEKEARYDNTTEEENRHVDLPGLNIQSNESPNTPRQPTGGLLVDGLLVQMGTPAGMGVSCVLVGIGGLGVLLSVKRRDGRST